MKNELFENVTKEKSDIENRQDHQEYSQIVETCRGDVSKAKAQHQQRLPKDIKNTIKDFLRYVQNKGERK